MRGRSYSYSPSPPRGYERRGHSPSPRGRYGGRGRDLPTSLLVRNLRRDCRFNLLFYEVVISCCRSVSPHNGKPHRERSYSHSPAGSRSRSRSPGDLPE
ncbi:hypothetical protein BHE74_00002608 [Ensete ventricosum]|uniref:Uncharacterized protein n=1 Tax=Ensete ventricosum TaxID=4639 RepID=A0A426YYN3_ENSVE|nr:hypothetical protein B296_00033439 [Ensete ventricosum]RWW88516.1 hypothetical protein BHE74_00002608 [Ensete ventricosum]RZR70831.1 hypothetical protein BHM03_00001815 [Ensete ventricosum]